MADAVLRRVKWDAVPAPSGRLWQCSSAPNVYLWVRQVSLSSPLAPFRSPCPSLPRGLPLPPPYAPQYTHIARPNLPPPSFLLFLSRFLSLALSLSLSLTASLSPSPSSASSFLPLCLSAVFLAQEAMQELLLRSHSINPTPKPCTLNPTPHTLHPPPYTPHPSHRRQC